MSIVTIRGQLGSGAPEIGKRVAERLHIDYVDKEIIAEVAALLKSPQSKIEEKEMPAGTLAGRIAEALGHGYPAIGGPGGIDMPSAMYLTTSETSLDDPSYLAGLESVIRELAEKQSIVIRGRGSQFILKNKPEALHILVVAPLRVRASRIMNDQKMDEKAAKQEINRVDSSSREFIKRYFKAELEDPINYDMVINIEHLFFEDAASIIIDAMSFRSQATHG
jgi:cytidylate kinase